MVAFFGGVNLFDSANPPWQALFAQDVNGPTSFNSVLRVRTNAKGTDETGFFGAMAAHFIAMDRADVMVGNRPVLYGQLISISPLIARSHSPNDDAVGLGINNNTGAYGARGTDGLYLGHNDYAFPNGEPEWFGAITVNANAIVAIQAGPMVWDGVTMGGHYDRAIDFRTAVISSKMMLGMPNDTYLFGVTSTGDTRQMFGPAADDSIQIGWGWPRIDMRAPTNFYGGFKVESGEVKLPAAEVITIGGLELEVNDGGFLRALPPGIQLEASGFLADETGERIALE